MGKFLIFSRIKLKFNSIGIGVLKPKRRARGQGQGHRGPIFYMHGKVLSKGMCVSNINGVTQLVCSYCFDARKSAIDNRNVRYLHARRE